ncbi:hypothetical protein D9M69_612470 [compost metagenome]
MVRQIIPAPLTKGLPGILNKEKLLIFIFQESGRDEGMGGPETGTVRTGGSVKDNGLVSEDIPFDILP